MLRVLLNIMEVNTEHQKRPLKSTKSMKSLGRRPKPSAGARSKLLVIDKWLFGVCTFYCAYKEGQPCQSSPEKYANF